MKFITLTISFLFAINLKAQKGNESVVDTDNDNEITKVFRATTERTKITSTEYFLKFTRMKDADFFKLFKTADLETANRLGIHEGAVYLSGENNQIEELASLDTLDIYFLYSEANRSDFSIRAYTLLFYIFRHKCPAAPIVPMFFETKESVILQFKASGYTDEEINPNIDRYVINLLLKKQNSEYSINRTWNFSLDYLNAILLDEGYFNEGHLKKD